MVAVSAPGKLILMGEHGAVYGRPALTAALDLRVRAELESPAADGVELDLPDLGLRTRSSWREIVSHAERARRRWQAFDEGAPFRRDDDPAGLVRVALGEACGDFESTEPPPLRLRIRSDLPVGAGFGSSAAVAVTVIAGFLAWRGAEPDAERIGRLALAAERRQHGRPSGVDHATVLRGGVQWASRDQGGELSMRPVAARPGLLRRLGIFDTGSPAESTGAVVAAVAGLRRRDEEAFEALLARMERAATTFRDELEATAGGARIPAVMREFERCLEEIGVVPEPVRRTVRRIEEAGGAAKISGAGALSGDSAGCLLTFFPAGASGAQPGGCRRIDAAMGAEGLRREAA